MPIASYVKEYRMEQARKLLRETNDSMAVIAQKVGYETQGKFTKAFKEASQVLPTEYRKQYQGYFPKTPGGMCDFLRAFLFPFAVLN